MAERMVVRELITLLGFEEKGGAGGGFEGFEKKFGSMKNAALAVTAAIAAGSAILFAMAKETANAGEEALLATKKYGVQIKAWQELAYAAGRVKVSTDDLGIGMKFLGRNVENIHEGNKEVIKTFAKLSPAALQVLRSNKPLNVIFRDLAAIMAKMPDGAKKIDLAMKLAGRSGANLIPLWDLGADGLDKMAKRAEALMFIFTPQQAKEAQEFNRGILDMEGAFKGVREEIGILVIEALNPLIQGFLDWYIANKAVITQGITDVVSYLLELFKEMIPIFQASLEGLNLLFYAFGGIGGFLKDLAAGVGVLVASFGLLLAIPGLLLEDYKTWAEGGDSLIGDLIDGFMAFGKFVLDLFTQIGQFILQFLIDPIQTLYDMLTSIPSALSRIGNGALSMVGLGTPSSAPTAGAQGASAGGMGGSVSVSAPITVTVPEGTPAGMVGDKVRRGVGDGLTSTLRQANQILKPAVVR